jgi:hypothetical protein
MECFSTEQATVKLHNASPSGENEKLFRVQYLRPGLNQVMFSFGKEILPEPLEFLFSGKKATIQFLSLSIYFFRKDPPSVKQSLSGNTLNTIMELFLF